MDLFDFPITPEARYLEMLTARPPLPYTPDVEKPHYFFLFKKLLIEPQPHDIIVSNKKIARAIKAILNPLKYNVIFFNDWQNRYFYQQYQRMSSTAFYRTYSIFLEKHEEELDDLKKQPYDLKNDACDSYNPRIIFPLLESGDYCEYPRDSQIFLLSGEYYLPAKSAKLPKNTGFNLIPWTPFYYKTIDERRYNDLCSGYGTYPHPVNLFKKFALSIGSSIREGTYYLEGGQVFIHPTLNIAFIGILSIALNMSQLFKIRDTYTEDLPYGPVTRYAYEIASKFPRPVGDLFRFCVEKKLKLIYEGIAEELGVKSICIISCQDDFHLDMTLNLTPRGVMINSPVLTLEVLREAKATNPALEPYYDRAYLGYTLLEKEYQKCVEKLRIQGIDVLEVPGVASATPPDDSIRPAPKDAVNFINGLLLPDGTYITGDISEESPLHIMKLKFAKIYQEAFPDSPLHFIYKEGMSNLLKKQSAGIHCVTATSFPS